MLAALLDPLVCDPRYPSLGVVCKAWEKKHNRKLTQARHAAGTDGGGAGWDRRPSVLVAESTTVEDEVAVPGLSLDTAGEPLLEVADDCGASGEKGSMSAINPTRSGGRCGWSDTMESRLSEERNRAVEAGRRTASRLKQTSSLD